MDAAKKIKETVRYNNDYLSDAKVVISRTNKTVNTHGHRYRKPSVNLTTWGFLILRHDKID